MHAVDQSPAALKRHQQQGRCRLYTWTEERWGVVSEVELQAAMSP
jgi:hypothetical protein